jgi:hypothetical protein
LTATCLHPLPDAERAGRCDRELMERRHNMTLTRKDAMATSLVGLAVLAFLATDKAWKVPLFGDSHRWAAAAILVLGIAACSVGARRVTSTLLSGLGGAAFVFGVLTLITGSLAVLALLVTDMIVMWTVTTVRHGRAATRWRMPHPPPRAT